MQQVFPPCAQAVGVGFGSTINLGNLSKLTLSFSDIMEVSLSSSFYSNFKKIVRAIF